MSINFTLIAQALAFAILIWFTVKYVWPPLLNAIETRQKEISDGLAAAHEGKASLEIAEKKNQESLNLSKQKSAEIISQAEKRANEIIDLAKTDAKFEAEKIITGANSEIDQEINKAKETLRAEVSQLAISAAEKILQREIKKEDHSSMLNKLAKDL
jgi:F-type H+-transporting ATPase subunit b|tara:strand:- start:115 stop:585 length:471 start_codon:yes stop_codon:yes gene_type:complete